MSKLCKVSEKTIRKKVCKVICQNQNGIILKIQEVTVINYPYNNIKDGNGKSI